MSLFTMIFGGYEKDSVVLSSAFVRQMIESSPVLQGAVISLKDGDYMGLEASRLESFLSDHVWSPGYKYNPEVFDCDDFAACARADILKAGNKLGLKRSVFVAELCYWPKKGEYHAANIVMTNEGKIWLYEPQTGGITKDLSLGIRAVGEIWG